MRNQAPTLHNPGDHPSRSLLEWVGVPAALALTTVVLSACGATAPKTEAAPAPGSQEDGYSSTQSPAGTSSSAETPGTTSAAPSSDGTSESPSSASSGKSTGSSSAESPSASETQADKDLFGGIPKSVLESSVAPESTVDMLVDKYPELKAQLPLLDGYMNAAGTQLQGKQLSELKADHATLLKSFEERLSPDSTDFMPTYFKTDDSPWTAADVTNGMNITDTAVSLSFIELAANPTASDTAYMEDLIRFSMRDPDLQQTTLSNFKQLVIERQGGKDYKTPNPTYTVLGEKTVGHNAVLAVLEELPEGTRTVGDGYSKTAAIQIIGAVSVPSSSFDKQWGPQYVDVTAFTVLAQPYTIG